MELKYQGARFRSKRNVRRFCKSRKKNGAAHGSSGAGGAENTPSRRKSFRPSDTAASSNGRKRVDDIVRCFQKISQYLVKGKATTKRVFRTCMYQSDAFLSRIYAANGMIRENFSIARRDVSASLFWPFAFRLAVRRRSKSGGEVRRELISLSTIDAPSRGTRG